MANLTVFQGRQCTRVRRAVTGNQAPSSIPKAASGTIVVATPLAIPPTRASATSNGSQTPSTSSSTSTSTPGVAAVPSLPGLGGQASVLIPFPPLVQLPPVTSAPKPLITSTPNAASLASQQASLNSLQNSNAASSSPSPSPSAASASPPAAGPTTAPKAPQPQPQPPAAPQNTPPNPSPTQQDAGKPQIPAQSPQPSGPFASLRPLTQLPLSQPQTAASSAEVSQGRGNGSGGNSSESSSTPPPPPPPPTTSNVKSTPAPPTQQSSQVGQLIPPLSQAQGTEVKTTSQSRQTLVPVLVTSNGVTKTTLVLPTSTAKGRNTDVARASTSSTRSSALPTRSPGIGAGANAGAGARTAKGNNVPIIAGVVSAFVVIVAVCAIIFIRARRKRNAPTEITSRYRDSRSSNARHIRGFWNNRFSRDNNDYGRSSDRGTPALERGMDRLPYMTEVERYRRRSSSEPATSRAIQQSPSVSSQGMLPRISALGQASLATSNSPNSHRRSVSSLSGMAYPVLTENNNPFMDPEPNAQLRIVNPDFGRSGSTASSTPRTPAQSSAATNSPRSNAITGGVAADLSPSPLKQSSSATPPIRPLHQRSPSILQDPFREVETIPEDPFADPVQLLPTNMPVRGSRMNHQRNKSSLTSSASQYSDSSPEKNSEFHQRLMAGIPLITTTAPSSIASSHRYQASRESGFASRDGSPAPSQPSRFDGLGISNLLPRASRVAQRPSLLPTSVTQDQNMTQPTGSAMASLPSPGVRRVSHNRLSSTSSASDLSLSFPASWGSPGPTRPASVATQGGPSLSAALAAVNGNSTVQKPRDSRASDPFDLDDPTLLTYAASEAGGGYRISTMTRTATQRKLDRSNP